MLVGDDPGIFSPPATNRKEVSLRDSADTMGLGARGYPGQRGRSEPIVLAVEPEDACTLADRSQLEAFPVTRRSTGVSTNVVAPGPLSLRRNFCWAFAGNTIYAACQGGLLVVLAKAGSREMVGQFGLGLAVTAPILMLANLQLRSVQATDARREHQFGQYLGLRLVTTVLALVMIVAVTLTGTYRWETALVILGVGLVRAFDAITDAVYGCLQQHERMDRIARSQIIAGCLSVVAMAVVVCSTGNVFWATLALAGAALFRLLAIDLPSVSWVLPTGKGAARPSWETAALARLAWVALPLALVATLISLETNVPRYFIQHYFSEEQLGVFVAIAYLTVAGRTVVSALTHSAVPRLAQHFAKGNLAVFGRLLLKLVVICAMIGAAAVLVVLVAGREILTLLYSPEYAIRADILTWLVLAAAVRFIYEAIFNAVRATRHFYVQLMAQMVSVVLLVTLSICLIPSQGLFGAALVILGVSVFNVVTYALLALMILRWSRKTSARLTPGDAGADCSPSLKETAVFIKS